MNADVTEGKWEQLKGKAREKWGRLTNDDVEEVKGNFEQLVGKIQERYGRDREAAEREVRAWFDA